MPPKSTTVLPKDFLAKPAKNILVDRIDFAKTTLPEYAGLYAVVLDNVLSEDECNQLLQAAEATTNGEWERAMVNAGMGRQVMMTDQRNCGRIIWDSRDVVAKVWRRIEHIPDVQEITKLENVPRICGNGPAKRGEVWKFSRANDRMRFLKYVGGEYFREHCDGTYETPDGLERSYFTLHLYLNNAAGPSAQELAELSREDCAKVQRLGLSGGSTRFHSMYGFNNKDRLYDVQPKTGRILLFQHRDLLHSGADVMRGVKYTMRTDLMYTRESTKG